MKTKSFQIFFSGVALLLLASLFACKNDKKNEPQGAKVESISFKQERYSVEEYQTDGINLKSELSIAPAAIADTCKITWELSNTDIATISNDGVITPKRVGWTKIFAKVQDKKAECEYSVKETVITAIYLTNAGVKVGSKVTLIYSTDPVKVPAERLMWSSEDTNIATVNENGEVTGVKAGMVKIWAQCGTVKKFCSVTVSNAPVESVVIEPATAIIAKGETKQFSAHVLPEVAETGSLVYSWKSSNTSVATIDSKGLVTAKGVGESDITVTVDGKSATSKLTVKDNVVHVTSVSVTPSTYSADLIYGAPAPTKQLTAAVRPDNATDKTVTWTSSNTSVATVSSSGLVTCKGIGTATITATADGKKGTCTVTFNKIPVTSVSVSPSSWTAGAEYGSTKQLTATVNPSNATDKTVTWSSGNTSLATVSSTGLVTCKGGIGTVVITAECGGKKGECTIRYETIPVTSVTLSYTAINLLSVGGAGIGSKTLTATVKPDNATSKTVSWLSSNPSVASVDQNGKVTGKSEGVCIISATAGGVTATCDVVVQEAAYLTDRQSNKYLTVKIGSQWWMAENLMCTQYDTESERKNEYIYEYRSSMTELEPHFISNVYKNWESTTYSGKLSDAQKLKLGLLYSWSAAVGLNASDALKRKTEFSGNRQGICPNGWHVPDGAEWATFNNYLGYAYTNGKILKSTSGWYNAGNGTDACYFDGLPSGKGDFGTISYVGAYAYYWLASPSSSDNAYAQAVKLSYANDKAIHFIDQDGETNFKRYEFAVRCVKN